MAQRAINITELMGNIETAAKIARILAEKYLVLEAVDLNSKFTDLVSILNNVKMELSEIQDFIHTKDKQIAELENALKFKGTLICVRDAYYVADQRGRPVGDAHCVKCWENTYKKRKLVVKTDDPQVKICPTCGQTYSRAETENIKRKFSFFSYKQ